MTIEWSGTGTDQVKLFYVNIIIGSTNIIIIIFYDYMIK